MEAHRRSRCGSRSPRSSPAICCGRTARPTGGSGLVRRGRRHGDAHRLLHTVFGWRVHVGENANPRSLRNFPMQANGAEMLRIACCLATERGIEVCAPVHDAVLICAPLERLDEDIARMQAAMAEASRAVLRGFELGTDAHVVRYPDRYMEKRGLTMWERAKTLCAIKRRRRDEREEGNMSDDNDPFIGLEIPDDR